VSPSLGYGEAKPWRSAVRPPLSSNATNHGQHRVARNISAGRRSVGGAKSRCRSLSVSRIVDGILCLTPVPSHIGAWAFLQAINQNPLDLNQNGSCVRSRRLCHICEGFHWVVISCVMNCIFGIGIGTARAGLAVFVGTSVQSGRYY